MNFDVGSLEPILGVIGALEIGYHVEIKLITTLESMFVIAEILGVSIFPEHCMTALFM